MRVKWLMSGEADGRGPSACVSYIWDVYVIDRSHLGTRMGERFTEGGDILKKRTINEIL